MIQVDFSATEETRFLAVVKETGRFITLTQEQVVVEPRQVYIFEHEGAA